MRVLFLLFLLLDDIMQDPTLTPSKYPQFNIILFHLISQNYWISVSYLRKYIRFPRRIEAKVGGGIQILNRGLF